VLDFGFLCGRNKPFFLAQGINCGFKTSFAAAFPQIRVSCGITARTTKEAESISRRTVNEREGLAVTKYRGFSTI
jgi:hypothetical protein